MLLNTFTVWLKQYQQQALCLQQRRLIVLVGDAPWALSLLSPQKGFTKSSAKENLADNKNSSLVSLPNWLVYSDHQVIPGNVSRQNYRDKLGTESNYIVFVDSQFNIDALAALSGTLVAGGVFFLLLPELVANDSVFLQRFINKVLHDEQTFVVEQNSTGLPCFIDETLVDGTLKNITRHKVTKPKLIQEKVAMRLIFPFGCVTEEQYQAVQLIMKVVSGHRNRPLVLTADRGRGKSSALAIACAQLLRSEPSIKERQSIQKKQIVITAAHRQALDVFFKQIQVSLPEAEIHANKVITENGTIEFIAIDKLLKSEIKTHLLLVDEAAAIPVYLLVALTKQYHRIVFSSTVHGYEGSGRGFVYKFQRYLSQSCPQWRLLHLNQAIRWAKNDPLEHFIFDSCLLAAELPEAEAISEQKPLKDQIVFTRLTIDELSRDERKLEQVFSILVTAHYQTSPSDLKLLLDNDKVIVVILTANNKLVAVSLMIKEGGCSNTELQAIQQSQRRLKDQFIPQSLLTHCGVKTSFSYQYLRIMRIAVHPELQGKGIGSYFLTQIEQFAQHQSIDFLGASFGANQTLVSFWQKAGFSLARLGFTQDKASGEHSALVVKPLNHSAGLLQANIVAMFYQSFAYLLSDEYQLLSSELVWQVLHFCPDTELPELTTNDVNSVTDFADKTRLYSTCVFGLYRWLLRQITSSLDPDVLPLIERILQKRSITMVCQQYAFSGKKALNQHLVNFVGKYHQ